MEPEEDEASQAEDLLQKLQNPCAEVREFACASISKLVEQRQVIPALLQRDAIRCLGPLLLDKCLSVRETAAGALRNLSTCGGFEVCDDMVTRDIMTPLVALLKECSQGLDSSLEPSIRNKDCNKNSVEDVAIQAVNVLWNVCESNSQAVSIFNKTRCVDVLLQCLGRFRSNMELALSAAYCLQTVTEDNADLLPSLDSSALQTLETLLLAPATTMDMRLLQTLIAGAVWNVKERIPASGQAESVNAVLRILSEVLALDAAQFVVQMKEAESQRLSAAASEAEAEEAAAILEDATLSEGDNMADGELKGRNNAGFYDLNPVSREEFLQASHLLVAQKSALELMVNMCCSDEPSDDEWEELSSSDESEMGLEKALGEGGGRLMSPLCLSAEIQSALLSHAVPKKVLEKTHFPGADALDVCRQSAGWKPLILKMYSVQHRALTCLHNILSMLDMESLGGEGALQQLSQHLSGLVFTGAEVPRRDEFLEAVSSAVRALLEMMAVKGVAQCMTPEQVMGFCEACIGCSHASTRVNAVSIIGITGSVLARNQNTAEKLKQIGSILLGISANDSSLVVSGGALDAIFDVFADGEEAEKAAAEINLLQALKKIQPAFKAKMRKEGREKYSTDQLCVLDNVRTNLRRFISYLEGIKKTPRK